MGRFVFVQYIYIYYSLVCDFCVEGFPRIVGAWDMLCRLIVALPGQSVYFLDIFLGPKRVIIPHACLYLFVSPTAVGCLLFQFKRSRASL